MEAEQQLKVYTLGLQDKQHKIAKKKKAENFYDSTLSHSLNLAAFSPPAQSFHSLL